MTPNALSPMPVPIAQLSEDELDRLVDARAAERAEAAAFIWRFRLVLIETLMMGWLVAAAGLALRQAPLQVARSALMVAGACFTSGLILIGLSAAGARLLARVKRRWSR